MNTDAIIKVLLSGLGEQLAAEVLKQFLGQAKHAAHNLSPEAGQAVQMLESAVHTATGTTPPTS